MLSDPGAAASRPAVWMILGGPALFLVGHAAFKLVVWGYVSWTRLAGVVVLALLTLASRAMPALALSACAGTVVAVVAAADRLPWLSQPVTSAAS